MSVEVRYERPRGCGHREVGGLYLMAGARGFGCPKLPLAAKRCPTCGAGLKYCRAWTWVSPRDLFDLGLPGAAQLCMQADCASCPCGGGAPDRAGLLWIGERFYPRPESFLAEAREMGISRRLPTIPHGFVPRETWVFLAHRLGIRSRVCQICDHEISEHRPRGAQRCTVGGCDCKGLNQWQAAVFAVVRPTHFELIVDHEPSDEALEGYTKRGITPVRVVRCNAEGVALQ